MADYLVRSPRQASTIYGLDGNTVPRTKSLFYVSFKRNGTGSASSGWQTNMGFVVKSLDRPSIQPEIQELNQYNKKRQVTVGYKIQPMKITLYDTSDSMVMQMWNEYSQWYFGDFVQPDTSWSYDMTTMNYNDSGFGFGYQPQQATDESSDMNSQFFFSSIEVYQVYGGEYTQFGLINPKITAFDPDEMDYAVTEPATISITLAYEAIIYRNNGQPTQITQNSDLYAAFQGNFDGDTFDIEGAPTRQNFTISTPDIMPPLISDFGFSSLSSASNLTDNSGNTLGGGSLAQFGNYDFGSLSPSISLGGGTAGDVSYLSTGDTSLSTLLNMPVGTPPVSNPESIALGQTSSAPSALNSSTLDATEGALLAAGNPNSNEYASGYIQSNLVGGTAASAILSQNSARDQLTNGSGLTLNSQTYGVINSQRPTYSQIGFNYSVPGSSSSYTTNSVPSTPVTQAPALAQILV